MTSNQRNQRFTISMRRTITDPAERRLRLAMLARTWLFRFDVSAESHLTEADVQPEQPVDSSDDDPHKKRR